LIYRFSILTPAFHKLSRLRQSITNPLSNSLKKYSKKYFIRAKRFFQIDNPARIRIIYI